MRRALLLALAAALALPALAAADDVESKANVRNKDPEVLAVDMGQSDSDPGTPGTQVAPVPGGTRTVHVEARAADDNGWKDLEEMSLRVTRPDGSVLHEDIEAEAESHQGRTRTYAAAFTMAYHEPPGLYTVTATATDRKDSSASRSATFEHLSLLAFALDASSISFGGVLDPGTSTHGAPASLLVRNTGNVPLDLRVSATDLVAQDDDATISASRVRYSPSPSMQGEVPLGPEPHADAGFDLAPGEAQSKRAYFDIHVPGGDEQYVPSATYVGTIGVGAVVDQ